MNGSDGISSSNSLARSSVVYKTTLTSARRPWICGTHRCARVKVSALFLSIFEDPEPPLSQKSEQILNCERSSGVSR